MDSQYVSRSLAVCLSQGLAELIEQRPPDPIEFLALWIHKYKQNQELQQQKSASQRQLEEQQRRLHDETVHQKLLEDEETRIRDAEEQLQKTGPKPSAQMSSHDPFQELVDSLRRVLLQSPDPPSPSPPPVTSGNTARTSSPTIIASPMARQYCISIEVFHHIPTMSS